MTVKCRPEVFVLPEYITGKPLEEVERELGITGACMLASNENPIGPSSKAVDAMRDTLGSSNLYPESGVPLLRRAIAAEYGIADDMVTTGNGGDNILTMIVQVMVGPGDEVIVPHPSFPAYAAQTMLMGGVPRAVPLNDHRVDLKAMARAVSPRTKIAFVCNPNNPTGTMVDGVRLDRFLDAIPDEVLVVLDEAYAEFVDDPDFPDSARLVRERDNVVAVRTFSKVYGLAALRIGYAIAHPSIIGLINRVREPYCANRIAQAGAIAALLDKEHLQAVRHYIWEERRYLAGCFDRLGLFYPPTQSNFFLVDVGADSKIVADRMLREGVIIRPGAVWGCDTWLRTTIGTREENRRLVDCIEMLLSEGIVAARSLE